MSDPTRRLILDVLRDGPRTTGQVAGLFHISRIAVMRHLSVLSEAGLVTSRKRGRERWHYINAVPLLGIQRRWVAPLEAGWAGNLIRLKAHAERGQREMTAEDTELAIDISQEVAVSAKPPDVFRALTQEVAAWWGSPYLSDRATDLSLDAELGGSFREIWGRAGGRVLATVTALEPGHLLELTGPFHLGIVYGVAEFRIDVHPGGTKLSFTHRGIGQVGPEVAEAFAGGWADLLGTRLRGFVERGTRTGIKDRGTGTREA